MCIITNKLVREKVSKCVWNLSHRSLHQGGLDLEGIFYLVMYQLTVKLCSISMKQYGYVLCEVLQHRKTILSSI